MAEVLSDVRTSGGGCLLLFSCGSREELARSDYEVKKGGWREAEFGVGI